jgi:hypothetical protein
MVCLSFAASKHSLGGSEDSGDSGDSSPFDTDISFKAEMAKQCNAKLGDKNIPGLGTKKDKVCSFVSENYQELSELIPNNMKKSEDGQWTDKAIVELRKTHADNLAIFASKYNSFDALKTPIRKGFTKSSKDFFKSLKQ